MVNRRYPFGTRPWKLVMEALFIGQTYIDVTFLIDRIPTGDEKIVARDYAVSFGGNAVSAAFCCAKLGIVPDLMTSLADDWLARMFLDMAAKYGISVHGRKVKESSLSFVMPNKGMRAIIRCRDDHYLHPVPPLDHHRLPRPAPRRPPGRRGDALCEALPARRGILTSLDGGGVRSNTLELLEYIDVAICSRAAMRAARPDAARRSAQSCARQGLPDRRRHLGRRTASSGTTRRGNVRHMPALAVPPGRGDRHQRRRRHLPRRLRLFLPGGAGESRGTRISASRARPRRIRCAISGSRIRCRRGRMCLRPSRQFREAA